jgi:catechol 2,3-dioxygenase-like lactoylglutathione lyase family enzyme
LAATLAGAFSVLALAPFFLWPILWVTLPALVWLIDGALQDALSRLRRRDIVAAAAVGWWFGFGYFLFGLFWIGEADRQGKKHKHRRGDIGLHHYAFELSKRQDVFDLEAFLKKIGATIVDPAAEYYSGGYYAVYFLDPDGLKLEGMHYPTRPRRKRRKKS